MEATAAQEFARAQAPPQGVACEKVLTGAAACGQVAPTCEKQPTDAGDGACGKVPAGDAACGKAPPQPASLGKPAAVLASSVAARAAADGGAPQAGGTAKLSPAALQASSLAATAAVDDVSQGEQDFPAGDGAPDLEELGM